MEATPLPHDIWNGRFHMKVQRFFKVSLCITCMDRLSTLRQCLPINLENNKDYPFVEFLILDYNSQNDDVWGWLSAEFAAEILSGRVVYYRTDEPRYFSMSHSRNMAFLLASGDIVNNVDADNFTGKGFCSFLNMMANECPSRAVFAKGKRLLRGRIGFFKEEFTDILRGYDEELEGYGYDDRDLFERAMGLRFRLMWFGGRFCERILTARSEVGRNMRNSNWRQTERENRAVSIAKLKSGRFAANMGRRWGEGSVRKNNKVDLQVGAP